MKKSNCPQRATFRTITALVAIMVIGGLASGYCFAGPDTPAPSSQTSATPSQANTADASATQPQGITGAELYSIHCNRCHPERYPTERTAANWKTINLHMQVRANIPPAQARLILKYLQDNSGR